MRRHICEAMQPNMLSHVLWKTKTKLVFTFFVCALVFLCLYVTLAILYETKI